MVDPSCVRIVAAAVLLLTLALTIPFLSQLLRFAALPLHSVLISLAI